MLKELALLEAEAMAARAATAKEVKKRMLDLVCNDGKVYGERC
jgi:hypothetical protein